MRPCASTGPLLHFEVRRDGAHIDPKRILGAYDATTIGLLSAWLGSSNPTRPTKLDKIKNLHTGAVDIPSWGGDVAFPN